jgi:hypothetical protein
MRASKFLWSVAPLVALATVPAHADEAPPTTDSAPAPTPPPVETPQPAAAPPPEDAATVAARQAAAARAAALDADDRLERILALAAAQQHRNRIAALIVHGTLSAAIIPAGNLLAGRDDPALEVAGIGLLLHGFFSASSLFADMSPGTMETLHAHHVAALADGHSPAEALAETEQDWRSIAETRQTWLGVFDLAVGGVALAAGMTFFLADPFFDLSRREQTVWGTVLTGAAIPSLAEGLWTLCSPSGAKNWWDIYEATKPDAPSSPHLSFRVAPTRGGATGSLELVF